MCKFLVLPLVDDISELDFANLFDLINTLLNSVTHFSGNTCIVLLTLWPNDMV